MAADRGLTLQYSHSEAPPFYENIDSKELAQRWGIPLSWIQNHTRRACDDLIPHVKLGAKVIFEWGSAELYEWWDRHRKRNAAPAAEGATVQEERVVARGVLPGGSERQRGSRLAANILCNQPN